MVVTTGATIAGLAAAGAGLAGSIGNWLSAKHTNEENWRRNEALTREQWARDDTAVQRRVADLKAAGLSPVLAAGSAANTSAPIASTSNTPEWKGNAIADFLAAIQQKANIGATNAGADLARFQSKTEEYKQSNLEAQTAKIGQDFELLKKQNDIFNLDAMSKIHLRNNQAANLLKQSELLSAETIYKQTELDRLRTQIDIEKINRDIRNMDLSMYAFDKINSYAPSGLLGNIFKTGNSIFGGLQSALNNLRVNGASGFRNDWYWDKK